MSKPFDVEVWNTEASGYDTDLTTGDTSYALDRAWDLSRRGFEVRVTDRDGRTLLRDGTLA